MGKEHSVTYRNKLELRHPFPPTRPEVRITESKEKIDYVDCLELRWWFAVPQSGDHTMSAWYEADTLELSTVMDTAATIPARIHQVDCMEIRVNECSTWNDWQAFHGFVYGSIEQEEIRWIAVVEERDGSKVFRTFTDESFDYEWGSHGRKLYDDGRYQLQSDGSYKITDGKGLGAGVYDVTIGENTFNCLRILDPDLSVPEGGELVEAYVERSGRTVFFRRYDGRFYRGADLVQKYPHNPRIVIDGVVYVQCNCSGRAHDVITSAGLGISP
jgi:hypothetical protein